jgi:short-subunit dehydrogenase
MNKNFMGWENPGKALITGASSGIGAEFAVQLAAQGFTPVLLARRKNRLEELASSIKIKYGIESEVITADLADNKEISRIAKKIREMKDLDILINNAGFGIVGKFEELDIQKQVDMIGIHNTAPVIFTHSSLPGMLKQNRGVIIYTSSISGYLANPFVGLYTPTKSFLVGLAESLRLELINTEIRVQALCPGFTHTEFHNENSMKNIKSGLPGFLFGSAADVVKASLAGAQKRKTIVIPGIINKLMVRFVPNRIMLSSTKSLNAL